MNNDATEVYEVASEVIETYLEEPYFDQVYYYDDYEGICYYKIKMIVMIRLENLDSFA